MSKTVKMQAKKQDKVMLNIDRFPHLKKLIAASEKLGKLHTLLEEKKMFLLKEHSKNQNKPRSLETVNLDIDVIELDIKIARNAINRHERMEEISAYHNEVARLLPEVDKNFQEMRKKALVQLQDNTYPDWIRLNEEIEIGNKNSSEFNKNWEMKMRHYLELKQILEPKTEQPPVTE